MYVSVRCFQLDSIYYTNPVWETTPNEVVCLCFRCYLKEEEFSRESFSLAVGYYWSMAEQRRSCQSVMGVRERTTVKATHSRNNSSGSSRQVCYHRNIEPLQHLKLMTPCRPNTDLTCVCGSRTHKWNEWNWTSNISPQLILLVPAVKCLWSSSHSGLSRIFIVEEVILCVILTDLRCLWRRTRGIGRWS